MTANVNHYPRLSFVCRTMGSTASHYCYFANSLSFQQGLVVAANVRNLAVGFGGCDELAQLYTHLNDARQEEHGLHRQLRRSRSVSKGHDCHRDANLLRSDTQGSIVTVSVFFDDNSYLLVQTSSSATNTHNHRSN